MKTNRDIFNWAFIYKSTNWVFAIIHFIQKYPVLKKITFYNFFREYLKMKLKMDYFKKYPNNDENLNENFELVHNRILRIFLFYSFMIFLCCIFAYYIAHYYSSTIITCVIFTILVLITTPFFIMSLPIDTNSIIFNSTYKIEKKLVRQEAQKPFQIVVDNVTFNFYLKEILTIMYFREFEKNEIKNANKIFKYLNFDDFKKEVYDFLKIELDKKTSFEKFIQKKDGEYKFLYFNNDKSKKNKHESQIEKLEDIFSFFSFINMNIAKEKFKEYFSNKNVLFEKDS